MKRLKPFFLLAVVLLVLPLVFPDNYYVTVIGVTAGLNAILAISLNLLMGYAGQISLGHAAFFGIGAYVSAILTTRYGWNPWPAMLVGMTMTSAIAFAIARPILRLKGHYLAMATLGLGIIVHIFLVQEDDFTGGPDGMGDIPVLSVFGWQVDTDLRWYFVIVIILLLVLWLALNIISSRSGRALRALHGSEVAAEMMGIDTTATKSGVFVLAALIAALAGSLFAHQQSFISPDSFGFFFSLQLVTMVVLGSMGSNYGAILGAIILTYLPAMLVVFEDYEVMLFGAILMLVMIFLPQGLLFGIQNLLQRLRHRKQQQKLPGQGLEGRG
ncbi:MAG TPA: branched-chain amino acid ABC transporter permease [Gammaproteobacteria bacterium]|nr:branched-chain amino acid ABC transporter permease [Gammaproteobacteria bacterium]